MDSFENKYVRFWFEKGVLMNELKNPTHITKDVMVGLVELRNQISKDTKQYWCMDSKNIRSINKEARDYADKYGQELLFATAALVNSHITKFMFNSFIKLKSPKIPFQFFTNREDAIEWLLGIKAKNKGN